MSGSARAWYPPVVATTPEQRLQRLRRHALAGWQRALADGAARDRAREWLAAHPTPMPSVDELWLQALAGQGPLAAWLDDGAHLDAWTSDVPLHSVLSSHPFPDLPQWTEVTTSRGS